MKATHSENEVASSLASLQARSGNLDRSFLASAAPAGNWKRKQENGLMVDLQLHQAELGDKLLLGEFNEHGTIDRILLRTRGSQVLR